MLMHQILSKAAQSVQDVLKSKNLECKVQELSSSTRTAQDAANSIGCDVAQIVKSLIFKTVDTHKPVLILVSGPNRVNETVVESYVGEKITKADAHFVHDVTGFAIGGIPPIGYKQKIEFVFIDQDFIKLESLWAAAGTPNAVFNLKTQDLLTMVHGKIINLNVAK